MQVIEIWGQLAFVGGDGEAWTTREVDPAAWSDWPATLTSSVPAGSVRALLDRYGRWEASPEFLRIEPGFPWKVRGVLSDETFRDCGLVLAALFRSASGAKGEITFASEDDDVRVRIVLENGEAKVRVPPAKSVRRAADEKARAELARVVAPVTHADTGEALAAIRAEVLAALEGVAEPALQEAIRLHAPNHMKQYRSAKAPYILSSMREHSWPLGLLLLYLAQADGAAAEPLALRALEHGTDMELRQRALSALGVVGSPAAVDRLIAELGKPVPAAGYAKAEHLGANWGLRHVRDPEQRSKIAAAAAAYGARADRHPDVERLFAGITSIE